jgi:regulator of nucleoside diphosphate kinase
MTTSPFYITRDDHAKIRLLLTAALRSGANVALEKLRGELDRATIIDPAAVPADLITLGSRVEFEDLGTNEIEAYILTMPDQANVGEGRLSILAPVGTALIGYRAGDIVDWPTPGGVRRLRICSVTPRSALPAASVSPAIAFTTLS